MVPAIPRPSPAHARLVFAAAAVLLASCGSRVLDVEVNLVTKSCRTSVNPLENAVVLRFTVFGDGIDSTVSQTSATLDTKSATIPAIPVGSGRNIVAEAFDRSNALLARGETGPTDFSGKATKASVTIFLRKVNQFDNANQADAPDTACTTLATARAGHTATLLENGKVLIAGGFAPGATDTTYLATTEVYDPQTGVVTAGPALRLPRARHTATHVPGTRYTIIAGGEGHALPDSRAGALQLAELYDESSNTISDTFAMVTGRTRHTAVLPLPLAENQKPTTVFFFGGLGSDGKAVTSTPIEFFDAANKDAGFQATPLGLDPARGEIAGIGIPGGVAIFGGWGGLSASSSMPVDIFGINSPDGASFAPFAGAAHLNSPHMFPMVARMTDGSVVVAGGFSAQTTAEPNANQAAGGGDVLSSDFATATAIPNIGGGNNSSVAPRAFGGAVALLNNQVLVVGGSSSPGSANSDAFLIYKKNGTVISAAAAGSMIAKRVEAAYVLLKDGTVLAVGGYDYSGTGNSKAALNSVEIFQPTYQVAANESHQ